MSSKFVSKPKNHGKLWSCYEMKVVLNLEEQGINTFDIARLMQRTETAIKAKLIAIKKSMKLEGINIDSYKFINTPRKYICIHCKEYGKHWIFCCPKQQILID